MAETVQMKLRISSEMNEKLASEAGVNKCTRQAVVVGALSKRLGVKCNPPKVGRPKK